MAGPISGKNGNLHIGTGAATEVADVRNWRLSRTADNPAYNSSDTGGVTKRLSGNTDWSATFTAYFQDDADVSVSEGDEVTIKLYVDASRYYEGNAIVSRIEEEVPIEDAGLVGYEVEVEANGELTFNSGA